MKTKLSIVCGLLLLAVCVAGVQGQQMSTTPPPAAAQGGPDPIARNLFPPDFIMSHGDDIGLTQEQRASIRDEIRKAQNQFTDMQWQLEDAVEALGGLLKPSAVDEKAALGQLEKVLDLERSIKRAQLGLMIRLKNKLSANQQSELSSMQREARTMPPPPLPRREPPPMREQPRE